MQDVLCTVSASDGVFQLSLTKFVELKGAPSGGLSPKVRAVVAYPHDIVFLNNRLDI